MFHKEKSIYYKILLPLVVLVCVQALIFLMTILVSDTTGKIDKNAVDIMGQTAENRKIILENNMTQHWSNIGEEVSDMNRQLEDWLQARGLSVKDFLADKELQREFILLATDSASFTIRKNSVNGSFVVFANQDFLERQQGSLVGVYFRDMDATSTPGDNSDIMMERGDAEFTQKFGIPFDSWWTSEFDVSGISGDSSYNYFNKPFFAAMKHSDLGYENLGYWSQPFYLSPQDKTDSYQMITYSVPLICDGQVYGVMGIDISVQYLSDLLPSRELGFDNDQSGYMLLVHDSNNPDQHLYQVRFTSGAATSAIANMSREIELKERPEYSRFHQIEDLKIYRSQACGTLHSLKLYNSNAPFSNEQWYLMAVSTDSQMFAVSRELTVQMGINGVIAILIGILGVYVVATMVTKPIRRLAGCIRSSEENSLSEYRRSNIREIDDLFDVIDELTKRQSRTEDALLEEKGRYQAALESSTASLFEYDVAKDSLYLYNFSSGKGQTVHPIKVYTNWLTRIQDDRFVHQDDREMLADLFLQPSDYKKCVFRGNFGDDNDEYIWTQLQGKSIYDTGGRLIKIIGSLRDVNEEKQKAQKEEDAKRKDFLTGLFNRREGFRQIQTRIGNEAKGCLMIFDISRFSDVNNRFGIVVGDVVLEELGKMVSELLQPEDVALRYGGDEFAVWFDRRSGEAAEIFYSKFSWRLMDSCELSSMNIRINAGYVEMEAGDTIRQMIQRALCALHFVKEQEGAGISGYHILPEEERKYQASEAELVNEIVGLNYGTNMSITSLVFNMFDKSEDLKKIMSILLLKVGRYYGFTDIVAMQVDSSFFTSFVAFEWHSTGGVRQSVVNHFSREDFEACEAAVCEDYLEFSDVSLDLSGEQRKFFQTKEEGPGVCYPIFIASVFWGSITFMGVDMGQMEQKDKSSLEEIVKVIATNLGKARSDSASRAKSDFLSRMSHEIRTPMNAIIGMTEIARRTPNLSEDTAACLKKIDNSSHYLLSIINDILDMSRIESGKMKVSMEVLDIRRLAEDVDTLIRPQADSRGITFSVSRTELQNPLVIGDSMRLNQVLINLLGNALKFTPEGGQITLTIRQTMRGEDRTEIYFSVKDTGIGISPENQERIFHAFEQEEDNTVIRYGGTGLGLAISSSLVKMMGGTLELTSDVGKGSDFYFTIPCNISDQVPLEDERKMEAVYDFHGKRLLLVEDNELNSEIAKTLLEADGFQVDVAENGQLAVERFVKSEIEAYDAILMDIRMPVMDGLEATRMIRNSMREDSRVVPIIAMSANAFDEDMKKSIESGMNSHLTKPLDLGKLHAILATLFEHKKE